MKSKLTLSVKPEAVVRAKRLARERRISVSSLFEQWSMRGVETVGGKSLGARLRGRWKKPLASEDPRLDYLLEKHTRR